MIGLHVFVIGADEPTTDEVRAVGASHGFETVEFVTDEEAVAAARGDPPACIVLDVGLDVDGESLARRLLALGPRLPVIVMADAADRKLAILALRLGAVTLLEKPPDPHELAGAIAESLDRGREWRAASARFDRLTPDEWRVLEMLVAGKLNKTIATELDVSLRTVESRRHNLFEKTGASTVAELVQLYLQAQPGTGVRPSHRHLSHSLPHLA